MTKRADLSIVIPCYNESANISQTLIDIKDFITRNGITSEVIVVDDGSQDDTLAKVKLAKETFPEILILSHKRNKGKGFAIKKGMLMANGSQVLFMDADSSTRIEEYKKLEPFLADYDFVMASRSLTESEVLEKKSFRTIMSFFSKALTRIFTGIKYKDTQCGFKLFKGEYVKAIFSKVTIKRWWFDSEIILIAQKHGLKIKEVPVKWVAAKTTAVRPVKDTLRTLRDLVQIKVNLTRGKYN